MDPHLKRCILIPMRAGSKGIKNKNIIRFEGKPLCTYVLNASKETGIDTWVSTDSKTISDISVKHGASVIDRPKTLALDDTPDLPVFQHFIKKVKKLHDISFDYIIHLRATYPRISSEVVLRAVDEFESRYDECSSMRSVVSATEIPWKMWFMTDMGFYMRPIMDDYESVSKPRQQLQKAFYQNAAIDIIKVRTIIDNNSMIGKQPIPFVMDGMVEDGVDIDTVEDLR